MGKKGKKNSPKGAAPAATDDDDALLAAAIARAEEEQKVAAAAAEEEQKAAAAAAQRVPLTQQQIIEKMNAVPVFRIIHRVAGDKDAGFFVCTRTDSDLESSPGLPTWYTDVADAQKALEATQAACPDEAFEISYQPLGIAVAISEGWANGQKSFRIQGSQAVVKSLEGEEHKLPEELAAKMNRSTGPIPLFSLRTLATETVHPVFFSRDDLVRTWTASGRSLDELPGDDELITTDLRLLLVRTLSQQNDWRPLTFAPPQASMQFCKLLHKQAVERGDEPPPLTEAAC